MRYENVKCPHCDRIFTEDDDVVVCPECATPHHRDCYLELGKCANDHLHSEGFVWHKTEESTEAVETTETAPKTSWEGPLEGAETENDSDFIKCPECGTKNKKNALICSNCANVLNREIRQQFEPPLTSSIFINGMPVNNEDFIDEEQTVAVKEAICYIQKSKESYIKTFLDSKISKTKPKFNIAAFFFGGYWFLFRKMYKPGIALIAINFALSIFSSAFLARPAFTKLFEFYAAHEAELLSFSLSTETADKITALVNQAIQSDMFSAIMVGVLGILSLLLNIFAGFKGNEFYRKAIKSNVNKIRKITPNQGAFYTYLYAKGGVSYAMPMLVSVVVSYMSQIIASLPFM